MTRLTLLCILSLSHIIAANPLMRTSSLPSPFAADDAGKLSLVKKHASEATLPSYISSSTPGNATCCTKPTQSYPFCLEYDGRRWCCEDSESCYTKELAGCADADSVLCPGNSYTCCPGLTTCIAAPTSAEASFRCVIPRSILSAAAGTPVMDLVGGRADSQPTSSTGFIVLANEPYSSSSADRLYTTSVSNTRTSTTSASGTSSGRVALTTTSSTPTLGPTSSSIDTTPTLSTSTVTAAEPSATSSNSSSVASAAEQPAPNDHSSISTSSPAFIAGVAGAGSAAVLFFALGLFFLRRRAARRKQNTSVLRPPRRRRRRVHLPAWSELKDEARNIEAEEGWRWSSLSSQPPMPEMTWAEDKMPRRPSATAAGQGHQRGFSESSSHRLLMANMSPLSPLSPAVMDEKWDGEHGAFEMPDTSNPASQWDWI
ncbi:hypothetical protein BDY21DRAFT_110333 [Lineolata rhizophorae]|uniref:Uncharacterized protein n=1 Tax=Lineolata rhizophorae TaxID=578093 RepID=A0A6A6NQC4_9PEZI|nr:hypothetical protein BDY21DRAFT_110333 [Lineolata rhizophorae]